MLYEIWKTGSNVSNESNGKNELSTAQYAVQHTPELYMETQAIQ